LRQSGMKSISLDGIKAMLAKAAMTEKNKRDLYVDERNLRLQTGEGI